MAALSSMRWLVVDVSPPESSRSRPSSMTMAAQPPGPGLPELAPLALDHGEVGLDAAQPLRERRLLAAALGLARLEARLGLLDLHRRALLLLHEGQDLFLDPRLLLLDFLDLGQDGGVLFVRLDLVELALVLLPLDPVVLEVLLLGALALP